MRELLTNRIWSVCMLVVVAGCNGAGRCGSGTMEVNGVCQSTSGCGTGTKLSGGQCVVDPTSLVSCGTGTHQQNSQCLPDQPAAVSCGTGTHADGNQCVLDTPLSCGTGTHITNGQCVPDAPALSCGPGTYASNGSCLPSATDTCGAGTHELNGVCLPDAICGAGTIAVNGSCVPDPSSQVTCGSGTHLDGNQCIADVVPTMTCGTGTHVDGTQCVPDVTDPGLSCGTGTHQQNSQCVPDAPFISCGTGTHAVGNVCMPDDTTTCGTGTHAVGNVCMPDDTCGAGTHDEGGVCVSNAPRYQVRVATQQIPADGVTKIPVLVFGDNLDGTPATGSVVLTINGVAGATLLSSTVTLTATGANTFLVPCDATATPACLGTFTIRAALASAPTTIVAESQPLTTVPQTGVGSAAACAGDLNVLFFDGDGTDFIHPGISLLTGGQWTILATTDITSDIPLEIKPMQENQGDPWEIELSSKQLGQPLALQVYKNAQRAPFAPAGVPGLNVFGNGSGCNKLTGSFQIEALDVSGGTLHSITATFVQHCENATAALRGCFHFQQ